MRRGYRMCTKVVDSASKRSRKWMEEVWKWFLFISVFDSPSIIEGTSTVIERASNIVESDIRQLWSSKGQLSNVMKNASKVGSKLSLSSMECCEYRMWFVGVSWALSIHFRLLTMQQYLILTKVLSKLSLPNYSNLPPPTVLAVSW